MIPPTLPASVSGTPTLLEMLDEHLTNILKVGSDVVTRLRSFRHALIQAAYPGSSRELSVEEWQALHVMEIKVLNAILDLHTSPTTRHIKYG